MLNRSASLAMSTSVLKALPGKLDIKRHSPSILYLLCLNLGLALTGECFNKSTVSDFISDQDSCFIRDFQVNDFNP